MNRRSFLAIGAAGVAATAGFRASAAQGPAWAQIKALAFDAFPVFDPRPVLLACEEAFPGHGTELGNLWRTRQFEYQWLRALGGRYQDFWQVTRSALEFAARSLKLELPAGKGDALMEGYLALKTWPEVPDALSELKRSGRKLVFLSNATIAIPDAGIRHSGLDGVFDQLGVDALGLRKEEILFVASAGWDAAGAKWFGYPTFWNNRQKASAEELDAQPDGTGESLNDLVRFLNVRSLNSA
jgi:2-haloacid dehalogenase